MFVATTATNKSKILRVEKELPVLSSGAQSRRGRILPVWLLRIRTKSLLRTAVRPRMERLRLGAGLLVMN